MEDKLRNLSQNIANNTGQREAEEKDGQEMNHYEDDAPREVEDTQYDDHVDDEPSDNTDTYEEPVEDEPSSDEPAPEETEPETEDEENGTVPITFDSIEEPEDVEQPEEPTDSPEAEPEAPAEEGPVTEPEPAPTEAAILTMNDGEAEPTEPTSRTKKYSPEVEAALSRLNNNDNADDLPEQLSTEPRSKNHHAGHILLFILFVLALAAVSLCILVEQKIIDNPFPNLFGKSEPASEVQPSKSEPTTKKYLEITEWGVKVLKPEGVNGFWYETVVDNSNEIRIFGTDTTYTADTTREDQGANAVMSLIRSTESTLAYSKTITLYPLSSLSGYYYYLVITSGDIEDGIVQIFQDELIENSSAILAL